MSNLTSLSTFFCQYNMSATNRKKQAKNKHRLYYGGYICEVKASFGGNKIVEQQAY